VLVDGRPLGKSQRLSGGEEVEFEPPEHEATELAPEPMDLRIAYEDEHLMVVDKPAGLVVHPASGHATGTLVQGLLAHDIAGGDAARPGIVHRLDRDTSGLMVVAKTDLAHRRLGTAIAARRVRRTYAALAWGHLDASPTVIEAPIARHPQDRKRMTVTAAGRVARTDAFVVGRFGVADLLRLELHTGRTHQIRVHLEHLGHPIVGDPVYGGGGSRRISGPPRRAAEALERATPRQALHAAALAFRHPASGEPLDFHSEWPSDLRPALLAVGGEDLVARPDPLGYLLFFNRDG
jgi:23S rRNA pseudouridine1911/1915/1917 synthase